MRGIPCFGAGFDVEGVAEGLQCFEGSFQSLKRKAKILVCGIRARIDVRCPLQQGYGFSKLASLHQEKA